MSCPPGATWTPRLIPKFLCQNLGQAGQCTLAGGCSKRRQISAAGCIICNLYRALKGIQWSNWEALKLKWGWDLESTLEPVVWREAWGSNSSVLISREPNINVFWYFYSSSPGVYTRVGFLFSFSFSLLFFRTLKPLPSVILEERCYCSVWGTTISLRSGCWTVAQPPACPLTGGSCPTRLGHQHSRVLDVLQGTGGQGELCPLQQPRGCSQGWLSLPKPCISTAPL